MATQRLRPGTWSLVKSATAAEKIKIDDEVFTMQSGQTLEFAVRKMATYDDTNISEFRTPPSPQALVTNVGDIEVERVIMAQKEFLK
tara:strand:- start:2681 stop:2941 length:261 start_codon:yes stop_codon:yes gene_type:complete